MGSVHLFCARVLIVLWPPCYHPPRRERELHCTLRELRNEPSWWAQLSPEQVLAADYKTFEVETPSPPPLLAGAAPREGVAPYNAEKLLPSAVVVFGVASMAVHVTRFLRCAPRRGLGGGMSLVDGTAGDTPSPPDLVKREGVAVIHPATLGRFLAFARGRGLDFLVLMSRRRHRKIAFLYTGEQGLGGQTAAAAATASPPSFSRCQYDALVASMAARTDLCLQALPPVLGGQGEGSVDTSSDESAVFSSLRIYRQGDGKASRKQVVPMIEDTLRMQALSGRQ